MKKAVTTAVFLAAVSGVIRTEASSAIPFSELDVDRDDVLSLTEAGTVLPDITSRWYDLDKDGDGKLNRGEYAAYVFPPPAANRRD